MSYRPPSGHSPWQALWGLADDKAGAYGHVIVELGGIPPLIAMLVANNTETRGFAAACLACLCADEEVGQCRCMCMSTIRDLLEPVHAISYPYPVPTAPMHFAGRS